MTEKEYIKSKQRSHGDSVIIFIVIACAFIGVIGASFIAWIFK